MGIRFEKEGGDVVYKANPYPTGLYPPTTIRNVGINVDSLPVVLIRKALALSHLLMD